FTTVILYLILLRSSTSTSFPYTTLFRSLGKRLERSGRPGYRDGLGRRDAARHASSAITAASARRSRAGSTRERAGRRTTAMRARDRKSTRLNSSHVKISYAVFCLKKKK